jgi:hypothetical protein
MQCSGLPQEDVPRTHHASRQLRSCFGSAHAGRNPGVVGDHVPSHRLFGRLPCERRRERTEGALTGGAKTVYPAHASRHARCDDHLQAAKGSAFIGCARVFLHLTQSTGIRHKPPQGDASSWVWWSTPALRARIGRASLVGAVSIATGGIVGADHFREVIWFPANAADHRGVGRRKGADVAASLGRKLPAAKGRSPSR